MSEKTCGTCKHRGDEPLQTYAWDVDGNQHAVTYYECKRVAQGNKSCDEQYKAGEHALVIDGSGYLAKLCVEDTFGCNLWEPK